MSSGLWYVRDRSKVTGPFNVAQLNALRGRGQLARFHEISEDRQTWVSATTLSQLFASQSPQMSPAAVSVESPTIQSPLPCWYYSLGKSPVGPISVQQLFELMQDGRINSDTLVWKDGLPAWLPLRDAQLDHAAENGRTTSASVPPGAKVVSPHASSRTRRKRLAIRLTASAGVILAAGIGATIVYLRGDLRGLGSAAFPSAVFSGSARAGSPIRSISEAHEIAATVGLVACGLTMIEYDGTKTEIALSTGTCFAVTDDGFLLTNRHVVEDTSKLFNAGKLRADIEDTRKLHIEPKIWVFLDHQKFLAKIQYESDEFDAAVLKIQLERPIPFFRLSSSDKVPRGTKIYALGFPGASREPLSMEEKVERFVKESKKGVKIDNSFESSDFNYVLTDGIVSLVRADVRGKVFLEHTARISGGNSGGPLVTIDGTAVGINTLVTRDDKIPVATSVALGTDQLKEELARNVPELLKLKAN